MNWKNDIIVKFSPVLGMEKTEELVNSIEEVYSNPDKYEDAIYLINYLIEILNENMQIIDNTKYEYKLLSKLYYLLDDLVFTYRSFSIAMMLYLIYYKDQLTNSLYFLLTILCAFPVLFEVFKKIKKK